jgi:hypothetical protein
MMNRELVSRVVAAVVCGILFGLYMHHDYVRWGHLGRGAFVEHELTRFDRYMAAPRPVLVTVIGPAILAILVFGLYEAIARTISATLNAIETTSAKT